LKKTPRSFLFLCWEANKQTMKYKRCSACDFWVTAAEKRCPNCGIADPMAERPASAANDALLMEPPLTDGARAAFGGFVGAVIGGFLMQGMGVAVGVAVGVSLGVLLGADREWNLSEVPAPLHRRGAHSLCRDEDIIKERLSDIAIRERRLDETLRTVDAEQGSLDPERLLKVRHALDSARAILGRQRERYHAKLWEIALVRWQNTLEPIAADWDRITHDECGHRLRQLDIARNKGRAYLTEWQDVDLSDLPDAERCVDRLRQALATCDMLREELIIQQAALAVRGIAPMEDGLHTGLGAGDKFRNLDIFNARASIGEFSAAFSELESEYSRLRSEEELGERQVLVRKFG